MPQTHYVCQQITIMHLPLKDGSGMDIQGHRATYAAVVTYAPLPYSAAAPVTNRGEDIAVKNMPQNLSILVYIYAVLFSQIDYIMHYISDK